MHANGALIASVCTGSVLLAEAGLLEGRRCAGHWAYVDLFRDHYPTIEFDDASILDLSGEPDGVITAGGVTAWQDLALHLIARLCGPEHALRTAKVYLLSGHEDGQLPFAAMGRRIQTTDAVVARSQAWIADHVATPNPVAAMAEQSGLAPRTFARRFRAATGYLPMQYVHGLRIERAKAIIEAGADDLDDVGFEVGLRGPDVLSPPVQAPDRPDAGGLSTQVRRDPRPDRVRRQRGPAPGEGGRVPSGDAQPPRERDQSVPAPAREQPGRLVPVGPRCAGPGQAPGPADLPVDRLRGVPLVPRHGARVVRGRPHRRGAERAVRVDQGGSRGAAGPRPGLHGGGPGDDRQRRLADERVPDARTVGRSTAARTSRTSRATGCRRSARSSTAWIGPGGSSATRSRRPGRG